MRAGARFGLLWSAVIIEAIGAAAFVFAPLLVSAFSRDPEVIAYGVLRGRICALFYCLLGFSHVSSAVMRGVGRPIAPMVVMLVCWCAVRVLVLSVVGRYFHDIRLACWIYPITWTLSSAVDIIYLRRLRITGLL